MINTTKELEKRLKQLDYICAKKCTAKQCNPLCIYMFEKADITYKLKEHTQETELC